MDFAEFLRHYSAAPDAYICQMASINVARLLTKLKNCSAFVCVSDQYCHLKNGTQSSDLAWLVRFPLKKTYLSHSLPKNLHLRYQKAKVHS